MKTLVLQLRHPDRRALALSGEVVLMTLLGGMGTVAARWSARSWWSPCRTTSPSVGDWVTVIIGAIFVVCVLAFRRGIVGELLAWQQRRSKPR